MEVELEPDRIEGHTDVEEIVAELPTLEDGDEAVHWDAEPLAKEGEAGAGRKQRYLGTRYEGSDASQFGIRVRVTTKSGTTTKDDIPVRESGQPDDSWS